MRMTLWVEPAAGTTSSLAFSLTSKYGGRPGIRPGAGREAAQVLGDPDLPHTVTYIDDFARALVTLGERGRGSG
jgi:hypothetical protein